MMTFVLLWIGTSYNLSETFNEFAFNFVVYFLLLGLFFFWTFTEYYMHRFSRHAENFLDPEGEADPDHLESIFKGHLSHHVFMN
jgi:uncharacterized membrane protein SpoIIM required for sporulation